MRQHDPVGEPIPELQKKDILGIFIKLIKAMVQTQNIAWVEVCKV